MESLRKIGSKNKITNVLPVLEPPIRKIRSLSDILCERKPGLGQFTAQPCDVRSVGLFKIPENSLTGSNLSGIEIENIKSDPNDQEKQSPMNVEKEDSSEEEEFESNHQSSTSNLQIKFGICCMEKKLKSRPMQRILEWLEKSPEFTILRMNDEIILNKPIKNWPRCDILLGFYSFGFPLEKAIQYTKKYNIPMINDLQSQTILWDRTNVIERLQKIGVPVAQSYVVLRGNDKTRFNSGTPLNQKEIEAQAELTKDRGLHHIEMAKQIVTENCKGIGSQGRTGSRRGSGQSFQSAVQSAILEYEPSDSQKVTPKKIGDDKNNDDIIYQDEEITEYDEYVIIKGNKLKKPFLEKPINAEDHEIYIHYSGDSACGSGYSVLFRKTANTSSQFFPSNGKSAIRTNGSYLYEEFLTTDSFDIKVYTVGQDYMHAEARTCPGLDGKVARDKITGKEVRYPVNLTSREKDMARRICVEFKQEICGFDMLRSGNTTYVCDVNGFSFVKTSDKYYQDCALMIKKIIYKKLYLRLKSANAGGVEAFKLKKANKDKIDYKRQHGMDDENQSVVSSQINRPFRPTEISEIKQSPESPQWELRSVCAVLRHGDRTPKQKMKMTTQDSKICEFFQGKCKQVKLKKPRELQKVLQIAEENIQAILCSKTTGADELKVEQEMLEKYDMIKNILKKDKFEGLNRKIQLKPLKSREDIDKVTGRSRVVITEALFILKFGGELTHAGLDQALRFGELFRQNMYVEDGQENGGLLRLHATYRHDLKCYTSDEGRCQKTAAAFLKGLLTMDGALAPILAIMVTNDKKSNAMLDDSTAAATLLHDIKIKLSELMHFNADEHDYDIGQFFVDTFKEKAPKVVMDTLIRIENPFKMLQRIYELCKKLLEQVQAKIEENGLRKSSDLESYRQNTDDYEKIFHKHQQKSVVPEKDQEFQYEPSNMEEFFKQAKLNYQHLKLKTQKSDTSPEEYQYSASKHHHAGVSVMETNQNQVCDGEPHNIMVKRWMKIVSDFKKSDKLFDISKLPEICDNIKFDNLHNPELITEDRLELMDLVQALCRVVVPLEYGITTDEKIQVGVKIMHPLLLKIRDDLLWWIQDSATSQFDSQWDKQGLDQHKTADMIKSNWRHVRSRYYFTSASHMYTLLNILKLGTDSILIDEKDREVKDRLDSILRLDFMSNFVFRLFENLKAEKPDDPSRFRLEIMVNRGSRINREGILKVKDHIIEVKMENYLDLNKNLTLEKIDQFLNGLIHLDNSQTKEEKEVTPKKQSEQQQPTFEFELTEGDIELPAFPQSQSSSSYTSSQQ